ncbi:beta-glucanase-like [Paramacrobiotus metropolitanus]|uniref:beta-glucanase-like n=1 Tax=Paramacrobiotus metropolitanus TaxID=2943436 RepID=UPI002445F636|nr:beta-glucanase-like [Paramacrobiotus metropolitanus]
MFLLGIVALYFTQHFILSDAWERVEIFADRFEDDRIDVTKWNVADAATATLTSNGPVGSEHVLVQPVVTNVWEKEHKMFLITNETSWKNFTTSHVDTRDKFSFTYGEVEWTVQMPLGHGVSAVLSLIPDYCNDPCQHRIDILYRGDVPNRVTFMVQSSYEMHSVQHDGIEVTIPGSFAMGFNRFKILWDDQQLKFYVNPQDGQPENFAVTDNRPLLPHVPMHLEMSSSVGGWYEGLPSVLFATLPSFLIIEEVTVHRWQ